MANEFFEVRLRVKIQAEGPNDAHEKAQEIVQHLNEKTYKSGDSVFSNIHMTGVVEVIPTIE